MSQAAEKLRLMVVDDEPDNLDLLYRTFRRDFEVIKADSAIAALQILDQQGEMAIIISDQRMPEMLGTEFLGRTVDRFPDTIRIVLTGYTDVEDLVEAINSGKVFKYITKPWNPEQLKGVIQQAAETYRAVRHRTQELRRALRRESLLNIMTASIRAASDSRSMLQAVAVTLRQSFDVNRAILHWVEGDRITSPPLGITAASPDAEASAADSLTDAKTEPILQATLSDQRIRVVSNIEGSSHLVVPLIYQQDFLAILVLERDAHQPPWVTLEIDLIQSVTDQASLAISQAKLYQRTQEQAEQMRAELEVARQIQGNLLRQSWPSFDGMKVQACCYPAREVGGDFFEVYVHPQGDLWLAVGDVSGKGVPAALFMASAISVLRRELSQEAPSEPHIVMQNLNHSLSEDLISTNCFITMVLARYTPSTHHLTYANAGHIYPLVYPNESPQGDDHNLPEPNYLKVRGIPLGILPVWKAVSGQMTLNSGEVLLLTSDGITEATVNCNGSQNSTAMLKQAGLWKLLLQEKKPLDLSSLLSRIRSQHTIQEDDQTILSLEVL